MYKQIDELLKGLDPIKAIDRSQNLGEVNLRFGGHYGFDKNSIEAFISYMAIAKLDEYSDLKETRSLYDIHKSEYFLDNYLSFYFRKLLQQLDNELTLLIDQMVDSEMIDLNKWGQDTGLEGLVFDFLVNRIAYEREIDLALYLLNNHYINFLSRAKQTSIDIFHSEFINSNLEFEEFFFNRISKVNFRFLEGMREYDIEMILVSLMIFFRVPISYKRAIKCYTYLCAFHDLGRKNRVVQEFMLNDILNHGLDLDKQQDIVPDNPIEPEETKKRGPKL